MATQLLRVQDSVYMEVKNLSEKINSPMSDIVAKAVEEYKKTIFFEELERAFSNLRSDVRAWQEELKERQETENTLMDGIEND